MHDKSEIRSFVLEKYEVITTPEASEAFKKYGFWLSPYETVYVDGVKHYRVIKPKSVKGGWAPDYDTPCSEHIPVTAHLNTLKRSKAYQLD